MVQTSVEGYQEERHLLWRRLIRVAALFIVGSFVAILTSVVLSGLSGTVYAANALSARHEIIPRTTIGANAPTVGRGLTGTTIGANAPTVGGGLTGKIGRAHV